MLIQSKTVRKRLYETDCSQLGCKRFALFLKMTTQSRKMLGNEPAQLEEVPEKGATGCAARFASGCAFGVSKIMQKSTESDPAFLKYSDKSSYSWHCYNVHSMITGRTYLEVEAPAEKVLPFRNLQVASP